MTGDLTLGQENPFRYRSYFFDQESGFYYLQSRYYDPMMGRFISADSQINPDVNGGNVFAYCGNNPVNMADPDGHWPRWVKTVVTVAAAAVVIIAVIATLPVNIGVAAVIGAATIGAVTYGAINYSKQKNSKKKVDPLEVIEHAAGGAASAALGVSGLGGVGIALSNFGIGTILSANRGDGLIDIVGSGIASGLTAGLLGSGAWAQKAGAGVLGMTFRDSDTIKFLFKEGSLSLFKAVGLEEGFNYFKKSFTTKNDDVMPIWDRSLYEIQ